MLLTDDQRKTFIAWLDAEIVSNEALLKQMDVGMGAIYRAYKLQTTACAIVRKILASTHTETV